MHIILRPVLAFQVDIVVHRNLLVEALEWLQIQNNAITLTTLLALQIH